MLKNEEVIKGLEFTKGQLKGDLKSDEIRVMLQALTTAIETLKRIDVEKIREVQAKAFLGCMDAPEAIVNYLQGAK